VRPLILFGLICVSLTSLLAQIVQLGANIEVGERYKHVPPQPTPRYADGRVRLGAAPGEIGMWFPWLGVTERVVNLDSAETPPQYPARPKLRDVPLQPWARALLEYRQGNQFEPHTRCKPSGGPRQFITPYGVQFVDIPEISRIFILDEGGPHTFRIIHMDVDSHPKNLVASYYGHSIGRWDKDTLVVDTRGINEGFWLDRSGIPHTDQLHMVERFTRTDSKTLKYEVTFDDPGAFTATWSGGCLMGWDPEQDVFEYVCQDNNLASGLMLGSQSTMNRTSTVVP
jgi:hypothetical protein